VRGGSAGFPADVGAVPAALRQRGGMPSVLGGLALARWLPLPEVQPWRRFGASEAPPVAMPGVRARHVSHRGDRPASDANASDAVVLGLGGHPGVSAADLPHGPDPLTAWIRLDLLTRCVVGRRMGSRPVKAPVDWSATCCEDAVGRLVGSAGGGEVCYGGAAARRACQCRGSSSARRRLGCVGIRSNTSRRYAHGSRPCALHVATML
jgi:hypothetical protein